MFKRKLTCFLSLLLVLAIMLAGCSSGSGDSSTESPAATDQAAATDPAATTDETAATDPAATTESATPAAEVEAGVLKLGVIEPLTGSIAYGGQAAANGTILAVEEINAAGGIMIGGKPYMVELVVEDDKGVPKDTAAAANKLIFQDNVPLIIGSFTSSCTLAAAEICNTEQVPIISPLSSAIALTTSGFEYFFRGRVTTENNTAYGAEAFAQLGFTKVAQLAINDDWGKGDLVQWPIEWEKYGIEVIMQETFDQGQTDFYPVLSKILAANPEAIFVTASTEPASMIFTQIRELDPDVKILTSGGIDPAQTLTLAGADILEGVWFWSTDLPDTPETIAYKEKYEERFGVNVMSNAKSGYDVMQIVKIAFENAGTIDDTKAIRDAMSQVKYDGLMGEYYFDETGNSFLKIAYGVYDKSLERGFEIFSYEDMMAGKADSYKQLLYYESMLAFVISK